MSRKFALLVFFVGLLALAAGCGKSGPGKREVTGTVKYDGQPVPDGEIVFISEDKSVGAEGGKIVDGKYTLQARDGKSRVEIRASRTLTTKKGPMGEPYVDQYIPDKYNDKSTLSAEIGAGKTEHNFDLK
jgi:hypothetical protein